MSTLTSDMETYFSRARSAPTGPAPLPSGMEEYFARARQQPVAVEVAPPPAESQKQLEADLLDYAANIPKGIARGAIKGAGLLSQAHGLATGGLADLIAQYYYGIDTDAEDVSPEQFTAHKIGKDLEKFAEDALPSHPALRESLLFNEVPEALGSTAPIVAATVAGGPVGGVVAGSGMGAASQYAEAKQYGASEEKAQASSRLGAVLGTTEAIPFLGKLDKITGGTIRRALVKGTITAVEEAIQESATTVGGNAIARKYYDQNREYMAGALRSGEVGGVTGAVFGVLLSLFGPKIRRKHLTPEGATEFVQENPEAAKKIAAMETPSRKDVAPFVSPEVRLNAEERAELPKVMKSAMSSYRWPGKQPKGNLVLEEEGAPLSALNEDIPPPIEEDPAKDVPELPQEDVELLELFIPPPVIQPEKKPKRGRPKRPYPPPKDLVTSAPVVGPAPFPTEALPADEQARRAASPPPPEAMGIAAGPTPRPRDYVPYEEPVRMSDEVRRRREQSHGVDQAETFKGKFKDAVDEFYRKATRAQEHIPKTPEFQPANEYFRLIKSIPGAATDWAVRQIAQITSGMGPKQLKWFELKLDMENRLASVGTEGHRHGFKGEQEIRDLLDEANAAIAKMPEVQRALEERKKVVTDLTALLVKNGLLGPEAMERAESYWHQQVLIYQNRARKGSTSRPTKKGFQKGRTKGEDLNVEELDYNTSYLESEAAWMKDAYSALIQKDYFDRLIVKPYNKAIPEDADPPEGHEEFYYVKDAAALDVTTHDITEAVVRAYTAGKKPAKEIELARKMLRQAMSTGERYVLPEEIVAQLDLRAPKRSTLGRGAAWVQNQWKKLKLFNPTYVIKYLITNWFGNVDRMLGGMGYGLNPKDVLSARRELLDYKRGNLDLSKDLEAAKLTVLDSGRPSTELPELRDKPILQNLFNPRKFSLKGIVTSPVNAVREYMDWATGQATYADNVARYAAYKSYLDDLVNHDGVKHFGAAKPKHVEELLRVAGPEITAAHLARNLIGDYGDLTVVGQWVRQYLMPFHAYTEIQAKGYPRMFLNAIEYGKRKGKSKSAKTLYTSLAFASLIAMYATMQAWNRLIMDEEDDDLSRHDKANPHITLGRLADGMVLVARNIGALGEFLEMFGANTLLANYDRWASGQLTTGELATSVLKDPINKLANATGPAKEAIEVITGKSFFPDVFNAQDKPRDELAAKVFGAEREYKAIRGAVADTGERLPRNYGASFIFSTVDPRKAKLSEIHDLRGKFLESKGRDKPASFAKSKIAVMRDAANNGNYDAFVEARKKYLQSEGNSFENFAAAVRKIDPVEDRLSAKDEAEFTNKYLNGTQRAWLQAARDYAGTLETTLILYWDRAAKSDTPEEQAEYEAQKAKWIGSLVRGATQDKKVSGKGKTKEEREEAQTTRDDQIEQAARRLMKMGYKYEDILPYAKKAFSEPGRPAQMWTDDLERTAFGDRMVRLKKMMREREKLTPASD